MLGLALTLLTTSVAFLFPPQVYKSGSLGRSLDITRFSSYYELRSELERLFGLEGQLEDPVRSGWQLVFVDRENDILLVGDDPWQYVHPELCSSSGNMNSLCLNFHSSNNDLWMHIFQGVCEQRVVHKDPLTTRRSADGPWRGRPSVYTWSDDATGQCLR